METLKVRASLEEAQRAYEKFYRTASLNDEHQILPVFKALIRAVAELSDNQDVIASG